MSAVKNDEGRPGQGDQSSSSYTNNSHDTTIQNAGHGGAQQQVRGTFVVVVESPVGRYRRRCYLSLASAERAADKAEAAGHLVEVLLCRLEPVVGWSR